jgi:hypothetical protein
MILLLYFNRFVRATVGPLFISPALMMVLSTFIIMDLVLYTSAGIWLAGHIKGVFGGLAVLMLMSFTLWAIVAWFGLLWIARRYRRRQLSDQTFLFDALWLKMSWATVPTTISVSAVEILNQMARSVATRAKPTHRDARIQTFCIERHLDF